MEIADIEQQIKEIHERMASRDMEPGPRLVVPLLL
jgi:hypothetical protein